MLTLEELKFKICKLDVIRPKGVSKRAISINHANDSLEYTISYVLEENSLTLKQKTLMLIGMDRGTFE